MTVIHRILVANRGEIACRIMRTIQASGRRAIAVFSDADSDALHVRMADDAQHIGPAAASESYLNIDAIIAAAQAANADAVHPGYGFLSENAAFARACEAAGLTFIGPGAEAIALMGNKAAAKQHMQACGVPCVPGYSGDDQSDEAFASAADDIGWPLMVKAAAGGGGRGMRLVQAPGDLAAALALARAEAAAAFGSAQLILERAIVDARHVEVQIIADQQGTIVHLGERDCSVQRRHQKVIEESPCPVVGDDLREQLGNAAIRAASGIDYRGAGTVEFLLDSDGSFYFLEMNTRLQVEHPVTELVTGYDLVALQIAIAEGQPLGFAQADVQLNGHAIEARLYAEDPAQEFLPQTGHIVAWQPPDPATARTDAGIVSGQTLSSCYDPMLAKIVAHGATRDEARRRLIQALGETALLGIVSNREFLIAALAHPVFAAGQATTAFIGNAMSTAAPAAAPPMATASADAAAGDAPTVDAAAAVIWYRVQRKQALAQAFAVSADLLDWRSDGALHSRFQWRDGSTMRTSSVRADGRQRYCVDSTFNVRLLQETAQRVVLDIDGHRQPFHYAVADDGSLFVSGECATGHYRPLAAAGGRDDTDVAGHVYAPMHGRLAALHVAAGDRVTRGQPLLVIEAMKMQHQIVSPRDARIAAVHCEMNAQLAADTLLIELELELEST